MSKESALALASGNPVSPPSAETAPAAVETPAPASEAPLQSTPFSLMAKKEAEIVRHREELKKERALIESEKLKIKDIQKQYEDYQSTKQKDPVAALKLLGFSETDIINYLAAEEPQELSSEEKAIQAAQAATEARIKQFEEEQAKKLREAQQAADQALIDNYNRDVAKVIQTNPEEFGYCNYYGKAALDLIQETVKAVVQESKGQEIVTPQEAAQMVEAYYEGADQEMNAIKKRAKIFGTQTQQAESSSNPTSQPERSSKVTPGFPNEAQPKPTVSRSRTLSGAAATISAASRVARNETREQKRERLMDALRNGTVFK